MYAAVRGAIIIKLEMKALGTIDFQVMNFNAL